MQPQPGAHANTAVKFALLAPGNTILGLDPAHDGHLTHGMAINFSDKPYNDVAQHVREADLRRGMKGVERLAREHRSRMIVAERLAYPRQLDCAEFRRIADISMTT